MSDTRSIPRWKRVFLCVSLLICLFTVNCSLFSVRARANAVTGDHSYRTVGSPFSIKYETVNLSPQYSGVINSANVYYYDNDNTNASGAVQWFEGINQNDFFSFDYRNINTGVGDIFIDFNYAVQPEIILDESVFLRGYGDITNYLGAVFGVYNPLDVSNGTPLSTLQVFYEYKFVNLTISGSGQPLLSVADISQWYYYPVINQYCYVQLFNSSVLTPGTIERNAVFVSEEGEFFFLISASAYIDCSTELVFIEPLTSATGNQLLSTYDDRMDGYEFSVLRSGESKLEVDFDEISWTDWLVNSVGAFMNFEIVPNLSLGGIFALLVGMSLFMIFLKTFAGG